MNNDLEQFSEERLKEFADEDTLTNMSFEELLALGRIALAAKQAKPVAYTDNLSLETLQLNGMACMWKEGNGAEWREQIPLYTIPQPAHTEQDGWIKCSERMPECSKWDHAAVIASEGSNSFVAYYNKHECKFLDEPFGESLGNKITHWMPLPKPPVAAPKPESE